MPDDPKVPLEDETLDWLIPPDAEENESDEWLSEEAGSNQETWEDSEVGPDALPDPEAGFDAFEVEIDDPEAPMIVGHRESVSLPKLGLHQIPARFSSDSLGSSFHAEIHRTRGDHLTLKLDQLEIEVPAFEQANELLVPLQIELAGLLLDGIFKVVATSGPPFLIIGRDAMAGQLLINPSGEWLKSRR